MTFTGPVAESYPVQATASTVTLLDPLGVSMHVTPAGEPQLRGTCLAADRDDAGKITSLTVAPRGTLPAATRSGASAADYVAMTVRITNGTSWILDTPTSSKIVSRRSLIGNGVEPQGRRRLKGRTADWVVVHLRDV